METGTGNDQITDARQTIKSLRLTAHQLTQSRHFLHPASDQRRCCIITVAQAPGNTCAQSNDIFKCAADFYAMNIRIRIHTKLRIHKNLLHILSHLKIRAGRNDGGGQIDGHLLRMGRTGQRHQLHLLQTSFFIQLIPDNLRHSIQCAGLDTLGHIHDHLTVLHIFRRLLRGGTNKYRRHRKQQDILVRADLLNLLCIFHLFGNHHIFQLRMHTCSTQLIDLLGKGRPNLHLMSHIAKHSGQRHTPGTGA